MARTAAVRALVALLSLGAVALSAGGEMGCGVDAVGESAADTAGGVGASSPTGAPSTASGTSPSDTSNVTVDAGSPAPSDGTDASTADPTPTDAGTPPPACIADDDESRECGIASDCCSGNCAVIKHGFSNPTYTHNCLRGKCSTSPNDSCIVGEECCTGVCANGKCYCMTAGSQTVDARLCCSGTAHPNDNASSSGGSNGGGGGGSFYVCD